MKKALLFAVIIILLIAPVAEVQEQEYKLFFTNIARKYNMATFPNTAILETFTGANGTTPPNGNWTNDLLGAGGGSGIQIQTNEGAGLGGAADSAYWSAGTSGPDGEVYMEVPTRPSDGTDIVVAARIQNPGVGGTVTGYMLSFERNDAGVDTLTAIRVDAGPVFVEIGLQMGAVFSDGDWFGMKLIGDQIQIWHNPIGTGAWVQVGTRTDSTYSAAGSLGIICVDGTCRVDNFGGGTLPTPTPGLWDIVAPEETTNYVLNPSAETTGNFAAAAGATVTRTTGQGWTGLNGYRVETAANGENLQLTLLALANAIHYVTYRIKGTQPAAGLLVTTNAVNWHAPDEILDYGEGWTLYGAQIPAAQANGSVALNIAQTGADTGDFYIDAVQVEPKSYWTTYTDGTQPGCEWNGAANASTSTRSKWSRAGGRVRNFRSYYLLNITGVQAVGAAPITNYLDSYAIRPGGQMQGNKVNERTVVLQGQFMNVGTDGVTDLNVLRQALWNDIKPNAMPEANGKPQPVILRYSGAAVMKQIAVHYESGLEANIPARTEYGEILSLWLQAADPFFYEIGNSAAVLDTNDSATTRYLAGRLRSTGQWDDLGLTANPSAFGTAYATATDPNNGDIYYGGYWTGLDGVAGRDYIARYTPSTDTWATVDGASDFTDIVRALAFAPNGDLYIGGDFQDAAGIPAADYLCKYTPSTNTISAVAAGGTGAVYALDFDRTGKLYFGGIFTSWNGDGNQDRLSTWDGAAYGAIGSGADGVVWAVYAASASGNIYFGGGFTDIDSVAVAAIASWDGTTISPMASGFTNTVQVITEYNNEIYAGGAFSVSALKIGRWDGQQWHELGSGLNNIVYTIVSLPDNRLAVGGEFTATVDGSLLLPDHFAIWNGSSWVHADINLPANMFVRALGTSRTQPFIKSIYNTWLGCSTTGISYFSGSATITNSGTENALPTFSIYRTGGTTATVKQIRNEETGKTLSINYALQDGETLTINLETLEITSSYFGNVPGAVLPGSDVGTFELLSGDNQITAFVDVTGGPTITGWVEWTDTYGSFD